MKRALIVSTALAVLAAAGCSSDDPDQSTRSTDSRPTPSTLATATDSTDPPDPTDPADTTDPTDPTDPVVTTPDGDGRFGFARLSFFGDCAALLTYMQTEARERVTAWGLDGGYYYGPGDRRRHARGRGLGRRRRITCRGAGGDDCRPPRTSRTPGTNTQEVGVDEGDIVETDGSYVYVAGPDGLRIVSVADVEVVASPEIPGGSHQMILDGNRLLVATQGFTTAEDTVVSVFDVSDPTNPALLRRSHLEGRLVASRAADGTVRLVLSSSLAARLPFVHPDQFGLDEDRSLQRNQQIIDESAGAGLVATLVRRGRRRDVRPDGGVTRLRQRRRPTRLLGTRHHLDRLDRPRRRGHPAGLGRHRVDR